MRKGSENYKKHKKQREKNEDCVRNKLLYNLTEGYVRRTVSK